MTRLFLILSKPKSPITSPKATVVMPHTLISATATKQLDGSYMSLSFRLFNFELLPFVWFEDRILKLVNELVPIPL